MIVGTTELLAYALLGTASGLLAGLLGVGGGLIIVPALIGLFTWLNFDAALISHVAIATSLASIMATSIASASAHHRHAMVHWQTARRMAVGLMIGGLAGAWLASLLDTLLLQRIFGLFALLVSLQLLLQLHPAAQQALPEASQGNLAGLLIGSLSGIVGIGGGSMSVPYLLWHGLDMRRAVATSAACGLPIAVGGFFGFVAVGIDVGELPQASLGYVYLPAMLMISLTSVLLAPVGAALARRLPVARLRQVFAVLLVVVGLKLLGLPVL